MKLIRRHIEWVVFLTGLVLLAFMDPATDATSFCLFELAGLQFCPGDGLGHSIAYTFRGDLSAAFRSHIAGPFAVAVLSLRVLYIWKNLIIDHNHDLKEEQDG